jgi:hypothetical protein
VPASAGTAANPLPMAPSLWLENIDEPQRIKTAPRLYQPRPASIFQLIAKNIAMNNLAVQTEYLKGQDRILATAPAKPVQIHRPRESHKKPSEAVSEIAPNRAAGAVQASQAQ